MTLKSRYRLRIVLTGFFRIRRKNASMTSRLPSLRCFFENDMTAFVCRKSAGVKCRLPIADRGRIERRVEVEDRVRRRGVEPKQDIEQVGDVAELVRGLKVQRV